MICKNLKYLEEKINNKNVQVVAVSKTHPIEMILEAYNCGHRHFGENKVQELAEKQEKLKEHDIKWHMIGHLQRNKVKYIAEYVHMIHSVDSFKLLKEINKQAKKYNRKINCLLQFHIAKEDTKFGFDFEECANMINSEEFNSLENICICGVMGMATFTEDKTLVNEEFSSLKTYFDNLKTTFFTNDNSFKEISMGMTNDWELAVDNSATILRIGSLIFGSR
jgi:PLP dependent protein